MAKRTPESQGRHYHMLTSLVKRLIHEGYTGIESELAGFENPVQMPGRNGKLYTSDAVAWKDGVCHVFEVETAETLDIDYTREQFGAFYDYVKKSRGSFCVLVPRKNAEAAREVLEKLQMPDVEIWTM